MGQYLDRIDSTAPEDKWPLVRQLMARERLPFFAAFAAGGNVTQFISAGGLP